MARDGQARPVPLHIYCPTCAEFRPATSLPLEGDELGDTQRLQFEDEPDIAWYRRRRCCQSCGLEFYTAEVSEDLLEELYALRGSSVVSPVGAGGADAREPRPNAKLRAAIASARRIRSWLSEEHVPRELAVELIEGSAWWLRHPSGPVRAPRHAEYIRWFDFGWGLELGANGFAAGAAIDDARTIANQTFDALLAGADLDESSIRAQVRSAVLGCVFNHEHEFYAPGTYRMEGNDLLFGANSIDVADAQQYLLDCTGLEEVLAAAR